MPQDAAAGTVTSVLIALSAVQPVYARKAGRATSAQKKAASFCVVFAVTGHFAVDARTLWGVAAVELRISATIVPKKPQRMKQRKNMWNLSDHAPNVTLQFVNPARQQQRRARLSTSLLLVSRRGVIVSSRMNNGGNTWRLLLAGICNCSLKQEEYKSFLCRNTCVCAYDETNSSC